MLPEPCSDLSCSTRSVVCSSADTLVIDQQLFWRMFVLYVPIYCDMELMRPLCLKYDIAIF